MTYTPYIVLIHKQLTGSISTAEQLELERWLEEDASHDHIRKQIQRMWQASEEAGTLIELSVRKARQRQRLLDRVAEDADRRAALRMRLHRIAAGVAIVFAGIIFSNYFVNKPITIVAQTRQNVWLADSARLILQPAARISFTWSPSRLNARFDGEGMFDLGTGKPAHITVQQATIDAEHASFFIRSREHEVYILVLSGTVRLTLNHQQQTITANHPVTLSI